ncbi:hypothetical protein [Acidiplasma sp.]|uniref:hypothetical protein n=1 Tax=Acidiplasma sp. TaxID=1872114 RepID=UPI0025842FD5|nr:hypothetical protein [Acidiplasma sp.]
MSVWDVIDDQERSAQQTQDIFSSNYSSSDYFKKITGNDALKDAIDNARKQKHGLVYHTKATGLPCHQWFLGDRVIVYLNPSKGHLGDEKYNNSGGLEKYILKEFGCTKNFLIKLIDNNLLFVKLDKKGAYQNKIRHEIEDLFLKDYFNSIIFAKAIETSISSELNQNNFQTLLANEEKKVNFTNLNLLPKNKSIKVRGVTWNNPMDKVKENYARLKILAEYFKNRQMTTEENLTMGTLNNFQKQQFRNGQELADFAYDAYLQIGTPIYYSLGSKTNSMGIASLNQSKVAKNIDKNGQKFKLTRQFINTTKQQNIRNILESWGQYVKGNPLPSKVDGYEQDVISTLHKSAFLDPDILDWITDIGTSIPLYFLAPSRLEFAILNGVFDTVMLIFSRLEKRKGVTEIPLKAGRRQPWFKEYKLFELGKIKGFYKDVSFKVFSFDYAKNRLYNVLYSYKIP